MSLLLKPGAQDRRSLRLKPPWLLVFDLDGTLIDSSRDLCASVNAALVRVGRPPLPQSLISSLIGDGASALVRRALHASAPQSSPNGAAQRDEELFSETFSNFLSFYRIHKLDTTGCYEGVLDSLAAVRAREPQLPMAVLTNKPVNPSREICSSLGLSPFFFANYGGDSFATKKPAPHGLLKIMDEARARSTSGSVHDLPASGVVMIGDSAADVLVARACGTRSVGCLYGLAPEELRRAAPDTLIEHPTDLIAALELAGYAKFGVSSGLGDHSHAAPRTPLESP